MSETLYHLSYGTNHCRQFIIYEVMVSTVEGTGLGGLLPKPQATCEAGGAAAAEAENLLYWTKWTHV